MARKRVAILISGRGSNMVALIEAAKDAAYPAEIVLVVSNEPAAEGLQRAAAAGIRTAVVDHENSARIARRSSARCKTSCKRTRSSSSASPASCGC